MANLTGVTPYVSDQCDTEHVTRPSATTVRVTSTHITRPSVSEHGIMACIRSKLQAIKGILRDTVSKLLSQQARKLLEHEGMCWRNPEGIPAVPDSLRT